MKILLASYPRSGNTLARWIIERVYGVPTYTTHPDEHIVGLWADRHISMVQPSDPVVFVKTHETKDTNFQAIQIVRDGRDAIVSHAHYMQIVSPQWAAWTFDVCLRKLITEGVDTGTIVNHWATHCRKMLERQARTVVVHFEKLVASPIYTMVRTIQRFSLPLIPNVDAIIPEFRSLHRQNPHFYRRGRIGSWHDEMPDDLHDLFWEHHGEMMEQYGYSRKEALCQSV